MDPSRFGSTDVALAKLLFRWLKSRTETRERHNERKGEARFWLSRPNLPLRSKPCWFCLFPCQSVESPGLNTEPLLEKDWTRATHTENAKASKLSLFSAFTSMWTVFVCFFLCEKMSPFTGISWGFYFGLNQKRSRVSPIIQKQTTNSVQLLIFDKCSNWSLKSIQINTSEFTRRNWPF